MTMNCNAELQESCNSPAQFQSKNIREIGFFLHRETRNPILVHELQIFAWIFQKAHLVAPLLISGATGTGNKASQKMKV
jgi:hypothetical protein